MKTREEIEAKYKEELAELERNEKLTIKLPEIAGFPVNFLHWWQGKPTVKYEARRLEDVLRIFSVYEDKLVPIVDAKSKSYRHTQPLELISKQYRDEPEFRVLNESAVMMRFVASLKCRDHASFEFYARIDDKLVQIGVDATFGHSARSEGPTWGFHASLSNTRRCCDEIVSATFHAPAEPKHDHEARFGWGSGPGTGADFRLLWKSTESFKAALGEHIEKRAKQRVVSLENAREGVRGEVAKVQQSVALLVPVLRSVMPEEKLTLARVRELGYDHIAKLIYASTLPKERQWDLVNTLHWVCNPSYPDQEYDSDVALREIYGAAFDALMVKENPDAA